MPEQKYEMVAGPPQHPHHVKQFAYVLPHHELINGKRTMVWEVNFTEVGRPMAPAEVVEALQIHLGGNIDRRTKAYKMLKAELDNVLHWMGQDIGPIAKPKPLDRVVCTECNKPKTLAEFGRDHRKLNGRKSACLKCVSKREVKRYWRIREDDDKAA